MAAPVRVVHYLNQFFGGIGGEAKASAAPTSAEGPVGPGRPLQEALRGEGEIVLTAICGDNFFAERTEEAAERLLALIRGARPDLFIAGPAFNSGRYGYACGVLCQKVGQALGIPTVTGMAPENPGVDYRRDTYIVQTSDNARGMSAALEAIARLSLKLVRGETPGHPREEGYFPRGLRKNVLVGKKGVERAIDMILAKVQGRPFQTELVTPKFDRVPPAPAVKDLSRATIALVTTGGLVPKGNPDRLESTMATRFGKYPIAGLEDFQPPAYEGNHGGYSTVYVNEDPDRLVPLDVSRSLEKEGRIGKVFDYFYTVAGCSTYYEAGARMGQAIARELKESDVQAALITAT